MLAYRLSTELKFALETCHPLDDVIEYCAMNSSFLRDFVCEIRLSYDN